VKIAAQKRENANKESVKAGEAAKRLRPARGELVLGFMGQVKSVFCHQEYEFSEEHISTRDAHNVERVPEESLSDAEMKSFFSQSFRSLSSWLSCRGT
jgi:hypothetical protein